MTLQSLTRAAETTLHRSQTAPALVAAKTRYFSQ